MLHQSARCLNADTHLDCWWMLCEAESPVIQAMFSPSDAFASRLGSGGHLDHQVVPAGVWQQAPAGHHTISKGRRRQTRCQSLWFFKHHHTCHRVWVQLKQSQSGKTAYTRSCALRKLNKRWSITPSLWTHKHGSRVVYKYPCDRQAIVSNIYPFHPSHACPLRIPYPPLQC